MFRLTSVLAVLVLVGVGLARADTFGTEGNVFHIEFVTISGSTNPTVAQANAVAGGFGIVNTDYRMGVYEITNDQWDKFKAELAPVLVTGDPLLAYNQDSHWTGTNVPTNRVSWYEAAQFVNWLNTSTDNQAAYNFTGAQGTSGYALATWTTAEAAGGTNLYRHKDAFYFLPTEHEWVKAAYFNGTTMQNYATSAGEPLTQGDGSGAGWNYYDSGFATDPYGPWNVGSGSVELNDTHDMMGNVWEWTESPYSDTNYGISSDRGLRGGSFTDADAGTLHASTRYFYSPLSEYTDVGIRVASIPEPGSITLLVCAAVGLLAYGWRRRRCT